MTLIVKKGTISNLSEATTTIARNGNANSFHTWSFRIDNQAIQLESALHASISEGDTIIVVGKPMQGTLAVLAYRNETTGAHAKSQVMIPRIMGVCFLILGIPLSLFIIGLPLVYFGYTSLTSAQLGDKANNLLERALLTGQI